MKYVNRKKLMEQPAGVPGCGMSSGLRRCRFESSSPPVVMASPFSLYVIFPVSLCCSSGKECDDAIKIPTHISLTPTHILFPWLISYSFFEITFSIVFFTLFQVLSVSLIFIMQRSSFGMCLLHWKMWYAILWCLPSYAHYNYFPNNKVERIQILKRAGYRDYKI